MSSLQPTPLLRRKQTPIGVLFAANLSFAAMLFVSPLRVYWSDTERRIGTVFSGYTDFFFFPGDFLILLTLVLWGLSFTTEPRRINRGPWYLTFALVALVALSWISTITSVDPSLAIYNSVRFTMLLGLYFFLVNQNLKSAWVAIPLACGILLQGSVALFQFAKQRSLGLEKLGELVLNPQDDGASIVRLGEARILRAYGLTDHPNLLGGFLAFALILILGYYLIAARQRARYFLLVPLALGGLGLFLSFSRSAGIAFAIGIAFLGVALLWNPQGREERFRLAFPAGLVLGLALLLPALGNQSLLAQRIGQGNSFEENSGENRSLLERDELIASANRIFYTHPLLGVGNGTLPVAMYRLDKEFPTQYFFQPPHFVLLNAATELGIPGGLIWLWLMVLPWFGIWIKRSELVQFIWFATVAASLLVITIVGLFDYYPWLLAPGRIWQWSAWGLVGGILVHGEG